MKFLKIAVATVFAFAFGNAYAFHSGGVGECEGCHSMHNSLEGSANVTGMAQFSSGPFLLKAQTQSGACLNCHEASPGSYHISTPTGTTSLTGTAGTYTGITQQTPGGDFAWVKSTRTYAVRNNPATAYGERQGHNIIAPDQFYVQDTTQTVAPGGTYPAANLHCSSCHDPHGKYRRFADGTVGTSGLPIFNSGSYTNSNAPTAQGAVGVYRLLAGVGYQPKSLTGNYAFANPSPDAVAPSSYNSANATIAGTADRVAYGQGMSEWCANCHTGILLSGTYTSGMGGLRHPAGNNAKLTAAVAANYNAYVSSGVAVASGSTLPDGGFSSLAPFETSMAGRTPTDYATLVAFQAAPTGASTSDNVMCLSCHRAHASGFESMVRFQIGNEFMTVADANGAAIYDSSTTEGKVNFGYSPALQQTAYNGRPATLFGPYARNYCNKCHAKD